MGFASPREDSATPPDQSGQQYRPGDSDGEEEPEEEEEEEEGDPDQDDGADLGPDPGRHGSGPARAFLPGHAAAAHQRPPQHRYDQSPHGGGGGDGAGAHWAGPVEGARGAGPEEEAAAAGQDPDDAPPPPPPRREAPAPAAGPATLRFA